MSTSTGFICRKCGYPMAFAGEHDTTAGCPVHFASSEFVSTGPTIWGSEEARKILRYDRAVELLENLAFGGIDLEHHDPRMGYANLQVDPEDVEAARAFLAEEPKK